MDFGSFKGILGTGKPAPSDYVRNLQEIIAGISRYTIDGTEEELAVFRRSLLKLSSELREQSTAPEIENTVSAALEQLREYNESVSKLRSSQQAELKSAMRTMTETITFLSESRTRSVHQLHFVEREMESAVQIDDIRLLRAKLTACLEAVRSETVRLQSEASAMSEAVRPPGAMAVIDAPPSGRFGSMDPVTGLPSRKSAEEAILDALANSRPCFLALFVVDRMPAINDRYGRDIGDEVMLRVSNHFAQHLVSSTMLYRWSGPSLIALAEIHANQEELRAAWIKAAGVKHEFSLEAQKRSVFVMVETTVNFFLPKVGSSGHELFRILDQVAAGHAKPDAAQDKK